MNDALKALENLGAELGAAKAENEKLRKLLTTLRISLNLDDTEYGLSKQEKSSLAAEIDAALSPQAEPMCETMQRPKAECGCPDCGSSLIDWPTAEPTDAFTATDMINQSAQGFRDGQAAVEPAPAQDEQAVATVIGFYEGEREPRLLSWNVLPNGEHRLYTRPAQTEQRPVGWFTDDHLTDKSATTYDREVADRWRSKGWPVHELFTAPIAQNEKKPVAMVDANDDGMWADILPDVTVKVGQMLYAAPIAQTATQSERSGFVLMPKEATPEIVAAMKSALDKSPAWYCRYKAAYRAALSAQGAGDADS